MLKINLLPPLIFERRKIRKAAFLFGLLFVGLAVGLVAWYITLGGKERELSIQVADMEIKAREVRDLEAQLSAERGRIPVVQAKVDFIENIMEYNLVYPKLYEELAKYTYNRVLYRSVTPESDSLRIQAHARSVGDCGRYLLNMMRASHLFSSVTIDSVPGWSAGQAQSGFDFNVNCALINPITAPEYTVGGGGGEMGMNTGVESYH